jgi:hypothetical protein
MPISTTIMLAVLTAMRVLCFAVAALFVLLALRSLFDADVAVRWWQSLLGAAAFLLTGLVCGFLRQALARRAG